MRTLPGNRRVLLFLMLLSGIGCWSCNKNTPNSINYRTSTISWLLANGSNTTLFESAVHRAALDSIFNGAGPFTVFVPTNDAFNQAGISEASVNSYSQDSAKNFVLYHTVAGLSLTASSFIGVRELKIVMASGDSVFVSGDSNRLFVNGVQTISTDLMAANGVMHALQNVLIPPAKNMMELVNADSSLSFLSNALQLATAVPDSLSKDLASAGPYTLFAPDNDAFRKLGYNSPQDLDTVNTDSLRLLILSHLVPQRLFTYDIPDSSTLQTVNDSTLYFNLSGIAAQVQILGQDSFSNVVSVNQMATNGVLFKIDEVLAH
ncbi:MAG: fasciclin domain-containing protein [Bacteroidota bacterium]|nr:fasciclin domain-containing protein [Bacteroidota bacterium]MDP4212160.1 fasciclin domain-containing protein [Bacteroidota bacterium]MDP4249024.1 fasciclin domain-containing protein [Bacteroidota bacterium]